MRALYGAERQVRFRTHYFPFTEPSMEPDVSCMTCGGSGCRDVQVVRLARDGRLGDRRPVPCSSSAGYDPEEYSGFAFGMGLERTAQLRHGVPDIRPLGQRPPLHEAVLMKVPVSWLRDYVAIEMPLQELADRLAISTCEVDRISHRGVTDEGGNLGHFRVGRVLEAGKHPNADRLQLCAVDVGEDEPRQIVCGAWNFGAGATVAVALPGAEIPGGLKIESRKLRGEVSDGMILSERELELGQDHSGIMVLGDGLEPGTPLGDVLPLSEDVLEVEVTGNRPDLLAIYGLAREIAALYELELSPPPGREPELAGSEPVDVEIADLEGCPRFIGRLLRGVTIGPSPVWLKARLTAAGMRPISNVVDATNYAMLGLGSPLHAYDLAKLRNGARIVVRRAAPGEELRTLDDTLRRLDPRDLVITDGEHPVALAAIMGGLDTEVDDATTDVMLEAANFEPTGIQASSERLGLRTEGSNRWEKGVDPHLAAQAATLATELMVRYAEARWTGEADVHGELPARAVIRLRPERSDALIGLAVPPDQQRRILTGLGFEVADDWQVTVPTWRARDVYREVDLVEEIARFELDEVPFTLPVRRDSSAGSRAISGSGGASRTRSSAPASPRSTRRRSSRLRRTRTLWRCPSRFRSSRLSSVPISSTA